MMPHPAARVRVGSRAVGDGEACYIIAEAGANHNRSLSMAKELIDAAAAARADAVKFQTYSAETLYSRKTPRFTYLDPLTEKSTWDLIKEIELPRAWQPELQAYARSKGIEFLSTPFDHAAVDELDALGIPAMKIASFELVDVELVAHAARTHRPLLLSTGMADYGEILEAMRRAWAEGNEQIVLLHCISLYPAPARLANLRAIATMRRAFGVPVGFSDHTRSVSVPAVAVGLGACLIEKHFTLDRTLPGPDHPFALEPGELVSMIAAVREAESAMGDGRKLGPADEEREMYEKARRSIVAARAVRKGTALTREMLTVKRPGTGIPPALMDRVVGRVARVDIEEDDVITWEMV